MLFLLGLARAYASPTWELALVHQSPQHYVLPSAATRGALRELVRRLAEAAPGGTLPGDAAERADALGLRLDVDGPLVWLHDPDGHDRGAGVLALRLGPLDQELVVEAPHPTTDENTGAITAALFDAGDVRAACIATSNRNSGPGSDPADLTRSWMSVMTLGLADALDRPTFVQLHGFEPDTSDADAVLSPGVGSVDAATWRTALRAVAVGLGVADVRTGDEVPDLAARDNAQGKLLARRGLPFWHLELSASTREALRKSRARRDTLLEQLLALAT